MIQHIWLRSGVKWQAIWNKQMNLYTPQNSKTFWVRTIGFLRRTLPHEVSEWVHELFCLVVCSWVNTLNLLMVIHKCNLMLLHPLTITSCISSPKWQWSWEIIFSLTITSAVCMEQAHIKFKLTPFTLRRYHLFGKYLLDLTFSRLISHTHTICSSKKSLCKRGFWRCLVARDQGIPEEFKMSGKSLQAMRELLQWKNHFFNNEQMHSGKKNKQRLPTGLSI